MSKPIRPDEVAAEARESSESPRPFVHRVRVRWADCDPAAVAYTGRIPAFALEAIEAWWEHNAGHDWYQLNLDRNIGTPFVHMQLDLKAPVTPRRVLECEVTLKRLGNSSIAHTVQGRQNGVVCFEGEFVAVFVDSKSMKPRTPPDDLVRRIKPEAIDG